MANKDRAPKPAKPAAHTLKEKRGEEGQMNREGVRDTRTSSP